MQTSTAGGGSATRTRIANRNASPALSLRVRPANRGAWRIDDAGSFSELCATRVEAEQLAERLVTEAGGGQILVYDAYMRLRSVKRLPG